MKKTSIILAVIISSILALPSKAQKLGDGSILGLHSWDVSLNEGVSDTQFETYFLDTYKPAFEKTFPGAKILLLKADRGDHKGGYGIIYYFKSLEERNRWIPEPGSPTEEARKGMEELQPLRDKMKELVSYESKFIADWIVL